MSTYRMLSAVGEILIRMHHERAPVTCRNFDDYVRLGLLRGTSFYRILGAPNQRAHPHPVAVVQGGLPYRPEVGYEPSKGLGPILHESTAITGLRHEHGTVTMARFSPGQTYGGFCICVGDQPELDCGGHRFSDGLGAAAFGQVVGGYDVVEWLSQAVEACEFLTTPIPIQAIEPLP